MHMKSAAEGMNWREATDPSEASLVCEGLAHPFRIKALQVLREHGGKMKLYDLFKECNKEEEYGQQFGVVKGHVEKMRICGLVDLVKERGKYTVILKKDVKILVKNYER